jgi:4-hydroxyphenylpyruvate dioxygenase
MGAIATQPPVAAGQPNPLGLRGIDFVEVSVETPEAFVPQLRAFGFANERTHRAGGLTLWRQNDIRFLLNTRADGFGASFRAAHGPSICAMGWRVDDARAALAEAVRRGAQAYEGPREALALDLPALVGIGGSLIYLVDRWGERGTVFDGMLAGPERAGRGHGFLAIDHLTNNVARGTLSTWSAFYRDVFGFSEVRHFDIRGEKTGLYSYALRSPDGSFCIPINEGTDTKSQIEEYLREYQGPGIQHVAFLTDDLLSSLAPMQGGPVKFLDIDSNYYDGVFQRVPDVLEDHDTIRRFQVLVDGDAEGYLLQIFTRNLLGPIFIELIQRRNHLSFGEGNFGALFRSIERDQERRGVL